MKSKMTGEVCMFNKFGFCKWEANCKKIHLDEICLLEECESRKCNKRHPRLCKYFSERGFCKYGSNCRFDHRPPKYIRSIVSRLKALEKGNLKLLKIIKDQKDLCVKKTIKELEKILKQIDDLKQGNNEKEAAIKRLEEDIENLKADKTQNAEKSKEKEAEEPVQESEDIVFETLITSRKKKWAMKDRTFAECIVKKYKFLMELLDWLDDGEGDDLEDLIKSHFLSSAEDLEEEVEERKITNKELKAAVQFFKNIVNRPDFTNQKYKQILNQGRQFIDEEMKKVLSV